MPIVPSQALYRLWHIVCPHLRHAFFHDAPNLCRHLFRFLPATSNPCLREECRRCKPNQFQEPMYRLQVQVSGRCSDSSVPFTVRPGLPFILQKIPAAGIAVLLIPFHRIPSLRIMPGMGSLTLAVRTSLHDCMYHEAFQFLMAQENIAHFVVIFPFFLFHLRHAPYDIPYHAFFNIILVPVPAYALEPFPCQRRLSGLYRSPYSIPQEHRPHALMEADVRYRTDKSHERFLIFQIILVGITVPMRMLQTLSIVLFRHVRGSKASRNQRFHQLISASALQI